MDFTCFQLWHCFVLCLRSWRPRSPVPWPTMMSFHCTLGWLAQFGSLADFNAFAEMQLMFPDCPVQDSVWKQTSQRLSACQLCELQAYYAWCKLRGLETKILPPMPLLRQDRTRVFAGLSGQRYPGNSSKGLDHLLPPGLGKERHMEASSQLPSPFRHVTWPELDVAFVIHSLVVWRSHLPAKTVKLRHVLRTVAKALSPLEEALSVHRVESARRVAHSKQPAFTACITALLRWPDVAQPQQLLLGYPIIGELEHSGIFRCVNPKESKDVDDWLAEGPMAISRIMASHPPLHVEDILATTVEEQEKGFCSPFLTKAQVDALFGAGRWRPLERFLIKQADGKKRVIDNAKKTYHNACTALHETISTTMVSNFDLALMTILTFSGWIFVLAQMTSICIPWPTCCTQASGSLSHCGLYPWGRLGLHSALGFSLRAGVGGGVIQ